MHRLVIGGGVVGAEQRLMIGGEPGIGAARLERLDDARVDRRDRADTRRCRGCR